MNSLLQIKLFCLAQEYFFVNCLASIKEYFSFKLPGPTLLNATFVLSDCMGSAPGVGCLVWLFVTVNSKSDFSKYSWTLCENMLHCTPPEVHF